MGLRFCFSVLTCIEGLYICGDVHGLEFVMKRYDPYK